MAKHEKQEKKAAKKPKVKQIFGFNTDGWLQRERAGASTGSSALVIYLGKDIKVESLSTESPRTLAAWQLEQFKQQKGREVFYAQCSEGPTWFVKPSFTSVISHNGKLHPSSFMKARDLCGSIFLSEDFRGAKTFSVNFLHPTPEEVLGALTGFEIASYTFKSPNGEKLPVFDAKGCPSELVAQAALYGSATNLARHLTNLPPNVLNPKTYADAVEDYFSRGGAFDIERWDGAKLQKDNLGLLSAVGAAAEEGACLLRLRYRGNGKETPFAIVGKGITFDSGGLDIKPPAGMRFMKKDMGGSAALVGFAHWLNEARPEVNCDVYLALAENAVSAKAFHPGDVVKSRNGLSIEIHNTDAEGRLVLADAIDVAIKQEGKDAPDTVINLATLTGAMRVAIGTDLFGLFSNDDALAEKLIDVGRNHGDRGWRLPLVREYEAELKSTCADLANASPSGFGGAITAALFLERFVGGKAWAHLDMYAWTDRPLGACTEPGGNGQGVMTLVAYAQTRVDAPVKKKK